MYKVVKSLLLMILSHFSPSANVLEGNASSGYKVLCQEMIPSRECSYPCPPHLCLLLSSPGFVTSEEDMRDGRLEHQPPIRQHLPSRDQLETCDFLPPVCGFLNPALSEWGAPEFKGHLGGVRGGHGQKTWLKFHERHIQDPHWLLAEYSHCLHHW